MHTNRLLRLAVLLEEDAINPQGVRFDLETWANDSRLGDGHTEYLYDAETSSIPVDCRTTACAMGLAAVSGVFTDEGLGWVIRRDWLMPTFNGEDGFDAAKAFFELPDLGTVYYLFSSDNYPLYHRKGKEAELAVAKRIRELAAGAPPLTLSS